MSSLTASGKGKLLICDTNVVVLLYFFKKSVLFGFPYSMGEVEVHQSVIDELSRWLQPHSRKAKKFGVPNIKLIIKKCNACSGNVVEPSDAEKRKWLHVYQVMEQKHGTSSGGLATSETDRLLLVLAHKNGANLATQEIPLSTLAEKAITKDRVFTFEDMVKEAFDAGKLTKRDIEDGLEGLRYYKENLRRDKRHIVMDLLK